MSKSINLTFTQCKQMVANDINLRDFIETVNSQPTFLKYMGEIDSIAEIQAIQQGGCESGAYMPAVTYSTALSCMAEHYDSVEMVLSDHGIDEITFNPTKDNFAGFASKLVSNAVELWCTQFDLDGVDWD